MKFYLIQFIAICIFLFTGDIAMAMGNRPRTIEPPTPKNPGKFERWQCSFLRDHVPPVTPEADALFKEARAIQKSEKRLTSSEEEKIIDLYRQAADMGHWKAMNNLAGCYLYGEGTEVNFEAAHELMDKLIKLGAGVGYFGKYFAYRDGLGVPQDLARAFAYRSKAAD
jgi:hypothetical protein